MAQRTADSLFESGTDDANFFMVEDAGLSANGESNEVLEKAQINVEEVVSTPSNDPYGQVQASSYEQAVKSDPYASQDRYAPIKSSTPLQGYNNSPTPPTQYTPTHTYYNSPTPVYDPYAPTNGRTPATSVPQVNAYDPYAPVAKPSAPTYSPHNPYPQSRTVFAHPSLTGPPKPPAPITQDVSKYRTTPNAYDPPIRSSPAPKRLSRFPTTSTPSFAPNTQSPYASPGQLSQIGNQPAYAQQPNYFPPAQQNPYNAAPPHGVPNGQLNRASSFTPPINYPPPVTSRATPPIISRGTPPIVSRGTPPITSRATPPIAAPPTASRATPPVTSRATPPVEYSLSPPRTSSVPPPRPTSAASTTSNRSYGRPPTAPSPLSRPSSVSSYVNDVTKPRSQSLLSATANDSLTTVEEVLTPQALHEANQEIRFDQGSVPSEETHAFEPQSSSFAEEDPEGGISTFNEPSFEDETSSIQESESEDPYAPVQKDDRDPYAPIVQSAVSSPPRLPPVAKPRSSSLASNASSVATGSTVSPASSMIYSPPKAASDPYAPPKATRPTNYAPNASLQQNLAPPYSGAVIDLSHSPPMQSGPLSYDPYNPATKKPLQKSVSESGYGQDYTSRYGYSSPPKTFSPEPDHGQYVLAPAALPTAYAPSPSLLGTNDPLGRASVRVPVISFGFGGKFVVCFHRSPAELGGFDVSLSARPSTELVIKPLKSIIPPSAYDVTDGGFPGPLFNDQGNATAASVLQTAAAATKAKKAALLQYLDTKTAELEQGRGYLGQDAEGGVSKAEGRIVLVKLLRIYVDNDGKLAGNPTVEESVRKAILGLSSESALSNGDVTGASYPFQLNGAIPFAGVGSSHVGPQESFVASYNVKSSSLNRLQELLSHGDRRQAYRFALDEKLWAHALLISSSLDKEAWKEVAHEFIKSELGVLQAASHHQPSEIPLTNGLESLRVAYAIFSGDGPNAMKELIPPKIFGVNGTGALIVPSGQPNSPNSPAAAAASVPAETWTQWQRLLSVTLSSQAPGDSSPTTALGDYLASNHWIDAAHCCYLLSLGSSVLGGVGTPRVRTVLFGSENPALHSSFHTDLLPVLCTEIAEYAMSLTPPVKGQEPFIGLPHLQAYRLWHAACLAEMGEVAMAKRYTDAINATVRATTRGSPYFTPTFQEQLMDLHDRLVEAPHPDKTKAWISKPSVRSFNDWISGGLEKLIQGDQPSPNEAAEAKKALEPAAMGPFSHYSAISSATPSTAPSPSPSISNLYATANAQAPRSSSATGQRPTYPSTLPPPPTPGRSSSAMDYSRRKPSPGPKVVSASATITTFAQAGLTDRYKPSSTSETIQEDPGTESHGAWWGSSADNDGVTPTATTFLRVENDYLGAGDDGDGPQFVSLMDNEPLVTPSTPISSSSFSRGPSYGEEDEEDLGFGNSKKPKKTEEDLSEDKTTSDADATKGVDTPSKPAETKVTPAAAQTPAEQPKGWFSWLRRGDSTPKPVTAKLGEENAFYFDKELGRWVNKKAGAEASAPKAPPPPPSRVQTASPGRSGIVANSATPPPPRSSSARPSTPLTAGLAPPTPLRPRSTLSMSTTSAGSGSPSPSDSRPPSRLAGTPVPPPPGAASGAALSTPPPPPSSQGQTPPPPMSTASSGRAKKKGKNRYVDVFQQQ